MKTKVLTTLKIGAFLLLLLLVCQCVQSLVIFYG